MARPLGRTERSSWIEWLLDRIAFHFALHGIARLAVFIPETVIFCCCFRTFIFLTLKPYRTRGAHHLLVCSRFAELGGVLPRSAVLARARCASHGIWRPW